jgi:hypothetical protein
MGPGEDASGPLTLTQRIEEDRLGHFGRPDERESLKVARDQM